jgi:hypothetical protein
LVKSKKKKRVRVRTSSGSGLLPDLRSGPRFAPRFLALLAGSENLTAPNAIMQIRVCGLPVGKVISGFKKEKKRKELAKLNNNASLACALSGGGECVVCWCC